LQKIDISVVCNVRIKIMLSIEPFLVETNYDITNELLDKYFSKIGWWSFIHNLERNQSNTIDKRTIFRIRSTSKQCFNYVNNWLKSNLMMLGGYSIFGICPSSYWYEYEHLYPKLVSTNSRVTPVLGFFYAENLADVCMYRNGDNVYVCMNELVYRRNFDVRHNRTIVWTVKPEKCSFIVRSKVELLYDEAFEEMYENTYMDRTYVDIYFGKSNRTTCESIEDVFSLFNLGEKHSIDDSWTEKSYDDYAEYSKIFVEVGQSLLRWLEENGELK